MKPLTEKDRPIIDRLLANRFVCARDEAERKRLERLYAAGWVLHGRHHGGRYYFLSYRATVHFGIHRLYSRAPGYSCLVRALATAALCERLNYERISAWQFERRFPGLCAPRIPQGQYCLADDAIGFVLIDVAQPAKKIGRSVPKIIAQRKTIPAFGAIIDQGNFFVVIVTAAERKKQQIDSWLRGGPAAVVVVPELLELL